MEHFVRTHHLLCRLLTGVLGVPLPGAAAVPDVCVGAQQALGTIDRLEFAIVVVSVDAIGLDALCTMMDCDIGFAQAAPLHAHVSVPEGVGVVVQVAFCWSVCVLAMARASAAAACGRRWSMLHTPHCGMHV